MELVIAQRKEDINKNKFWTSHLSAVEYLASVNDKWPYKHCQYCKNVLQEPIRLKHGYTKNIELRTPCNIFHFHSASGPTKKFIRIKVHNGFMINITIYKSYVPYNDN